MLSINTYSLSKQQNQANDNSMFTSFKNRSLVEKICFILQIIGNVVLVVINDSFE